MQHDKAQVDLVKLRKLVRLSHFLDDLPHDRFHMPDFASEDATPTSCGTAGCAAGWAATIFSSEGWVFNRTHKAIPYYRGLAGSPAFAMFFGLPLSEAEWICMTGIPAGERGYQSEYNLESASEITPRHAADRIRKVVAKYAPELLEEEWHPTKRPDGRQPSPHVAHAALQTAIEDGREGVEAEEVERFDEATGPIEGERP